MGPEPELEDRGEQAYVGVRRSVTSETFAAAVDSAFPELFAWLAERGEPMTGPPFVRYHVVDVNGTFEIELCVPVAAGVAGDARIPAGALPAGRYLTLRHTGPYDGLAAVHEELQAWAAAHGVALDREEANGATTWRASFEVYVTNPVEEPDPARWIVDLGYLTTA
jgi:effector-binding domain-containing protein